MTMTEIRAEFKKVIESRKAMGLPELAEYMEEQKNIVETLWKNGIVRDFTEDTLRLANGYQISRSDYEGFHIYQTYGLRGIKATKASVKAFAEFILN